MTWQIKYEKSLKSDWKKIDKKQKERILKFIDKLLKLDDPRDTGEALKGNELGRFWKYRVGNYRIIAEIQDKVLIIVIIRIGHRKEIYKS